MPTKGEELIIGHSSLIIGHLLLLTIHYPLSTIFAFMLKNYTIINANIPDFQGLQYIQINQAGKISQIASMNYFSAECIAENHLDLKGDFLSLGGVDLQINGALGLAFPDLKPADLPKLTEICNYLWQEGIDGFLPTIVTTSLEKIQQSLAVLAEFMSLQTPEAQTAQILGVHLEGPFLNPEKRGAHPQQYLLPLTLENVQKVLGDYADIVKIITLAPELEPTKEIISYLRSLGITISLGHSLATSDQAKIAFEQGATMVTHAFNAMPTLHHREAGLLGEALINPHVFCGFIADGQHISTTMLKILLKAGDAHKGLFLVSDALAPIGLKEGIYPWDEREIEVKQGTARLLNGTLAGTTLPLLEGVNNLIKWHCCSPEIAIALATTSPRQAIVLTSFKIGQIAHFLQWSWQNHQNQLRWKRL
jgi:N-acetylglucosamine-6-phosphate deacetylase